MWLVVFKEGFSNSCCFFMGLACFVRVVFVWIKVSDDKGRIMSNW